MSEILWQIISLLLATGLSVVFLAVLFWPLESAYPARPDQKRFRPHWFTDLCFLLGQYLIFNGLILGLLTLVSIWLDGVVPATFRSLVRSQPWWLQALEVVTLRAYPKTPAAA